MEREQFEALVKRLEQRSQDDPRGYKTRVLALALLGYVYIVFVLGVLLLLLCGLVWGAVSTHAIGLLIGKLGFLLLGLIYVVMRSLWVKIEPPGGLPLTPQNAPELFALIDEVAGQLQCRRPDLVLLNDEFNCSVAQIPRLGILGWYREYLMLGLPLMHAVSPDEFKAILAHEFGHLSGNHGRFSGWIYRVRAAWYQLMESLRGQSGASIFKAFFNWYAPYFGAYSFVLARADEYVADKCACDVTSTRASADALLRISIANSFLDEKFWPGIFRKADSQNTPPSPFLHLKGALAVFEPEPAQRWMNRAIAELTTGTDTHPSLTDRLAAMGEKPRIPSPLTSSAAEAYLGRALDDLTTQINTAWTEMITPAWQERHKSRLEDQAKLQELDEKQANGEKLGEHEALQRANWIEDFRGEDEALQAFREFVEAYPDNAAGHFSVGRLLLERDDINGVEAVEKAIATDPQAVLPGYQVLHNFWAERGQIEKAHEVFQHAVKESDTVETALEERNRLLPGDTFLPHELNDEALAPLRAVLLQDERVEKAHLVRKKVEHSAQPLYVLGITFASKWYQFEDEAKFMQWSAELTQILPFPGECFVLPLHGDAAAFKAPLTKVPNAQIFQRTGAN